MMSNATTVETLDPRTVAAGLAAGQILLVDVREPGEYALERIPGALLYPLSTFDPAALPPDGERRLVLHCGVGKRSLDAALRCLAAGRASAAHVGGGLAAWKAAGLPLLAAR